MTLFKTYKIETIFAHKLEAAIKTVWSIQNEKFQTNTDDEITDFIFNDYLIKDFSMNFESTKVETNDCEVTVRSRNGNSIRLPGTRYTYWIPYIGNFDLLGYDCDAIITGGGSRDYEVDFKYQSIVIRESFDMTTTGESVRKSFDSTKSYISSYLNSVSERVRGFNESLRENIKTAITSKRKKIESDKEIVRSLGFELFKRDNAPNTYKLPLERKTVELKSAPLGATKEPNEYHLDNTHYEQMLDIIYNMSRVIECSPSAFKDQEEELVRIHFLVQLNGQYRGLATGETFNVNGKTDIFIQHEGKPLFIAECKFWKGEQSLHDAIDQLYTYTCWRDTKVALLIFNRNKDFSAVLDKIKEEVPKHSGYITTQSYGKYETASRYEFQHPTDKEHRILLTVMAFDLRCDD